MNTLSFADRIPQETWQSLLKGIERADQIDCKGLPLAAQAWLMSELVKKNVAGKKQRPLFWICEDVKTQEALASDLISWGVDCVFYPQSDWKEEMGVPDLQIELEQWAAWKRLIRLDADVGLITQASLNQKQIDLETLQRLVICLTRGDRISIESFIQQLIDANLLRERKVYQVGHWTQRGAILDVWPWDSLHPIRIEWEDDTISSIRYFDPDLQRSLNPIDRVEMLIHHPSQEQGIAPSLTPIETLLHSLVKEKKAIWCNRYDVESTTYTCGIECFEHSFLLATRPFEHDQVLQVNRRRLFFTHLKHWIETQWQIDVCCNNEGEEQRLRQIIEEELTAETLKKLRFHQIPLLHGFTYPEGRWVLITDAEIFGRYQTLRVLRKKERLARVRGQSLSFSLSELAQGDYVVHLHHGIGRYRGLQTIPSEDSNSGEEAIVLEYAEGAKLYVPLSQSYLISRYVGVNKKAPQLDTLGGNRWERAKKNAEKAIWDYAAKLLKIQAERETLQGYAFPEDDDWQREFEMSFIYEPTPDQSKAIAATKADMQSTRPMDRLICGDVGFGKTEVAIRALFKCAISGKQAAFLAPTTVLAQQHYRNLCERMADYPIKIELLNRFKTQKEQKIIIEAIADGKVDIVVGTHRLLSPDVHFKDLGLVVIDEEQRFGVIQKEKFKERHRLVHILSLSATPIPRTLYLSLAGVKDMSVIETPPANRLPVETIICPYDERIIKAAIERELSRNGQIYFLHNRIGSIYTLADRIRSLLPECKIDVGHGRMPKHQLEEVMQRFVDGKTDLLLATSIIENGLDIPNANTIIIDRADRFGLSDLYQLRGRVGRAHHKGYAYLLLPRHLMSVTNARKRVNALQQYSKLGDGFKISMRDLELRGAGNLLGVEQSGHISTIGFDLYCRLLKAAVSSLKGERPAWQNETRLRIDFISLSEPSHPSTDGVHHAYLPKTYFQDQEGIIENYKRLNEALTPSELDQLCEEWRDCYGPWPLPVTLLLEIHHIRILAAQAQISHVETQNNKIILKRNNDFIMIGGKFPRLTAQDPLLKLQELKKWIRSFIQNEKLHPSSSH
ncbi:MAG: transcription-repair coupling factor [Verrucomicrobiae bacterium]|nr:transcription-repair coupling factor [Verrucomicrobiae bacterium]